MNDSTIRENVRLRVKELSQVIRDRGLPDFPVPDVEFYDKRLAAGVANYRRHRVSFNIVYFRENYAAMMGETVAHEVAHLAHWAGVQAGMFRQRRDGRGRVKREPHGPYWQYIMRDWFGVEPERCHDFSTANVRAKKQRRHRALCRCMSHEITTTRRNKMLRGTKYRCARCKQDLILAPL